MNPSEIDKPAEEVLSQDSDLRLTIMPRALRITRATVSTNGPKIN
jgi:hypothetical protein